MKDLLKKTILTGIGIASMTKDKIEDIATKIAEQSKLSKEEGEKFVKDILKESDNAKKNLETQVDKLVANTLKKLNIPKREDIENLEKRIKKLEDSTKKMKK